MKTTRIVALISLFALCGLAFGQTIQFGLGDATLEASLNQIGARATIDTGAFVAEINLQWGVPPKSVEASLAGGLAPAEVYLAAGLANISGKPIETVVTLYKTDKSKGWGYIAKELGIKPGSKEFKALKDGTDRSAAKGKKK